MNKVTAGIIALAVGTVIFCLGIKAGHSGCECKPADCKCCSACCKMK